MHWILQDNLFNEKEWGNLVGSLERFKIPFSVHKVVPFSGELIPAAEPEQEKVVCFGSYSMRHVAKANNWNPGVYDIFQQNFQIQLSHWGDMMLNHDSIVMMFKDVQKLTESTFIRPIDDSKYFAGKVFEPEDFNDWQHKVVDLGEDYGNSLSGETLVQICIPKKIYAEYRFWVVNQEIVAASLYKRGDRVIYSGLDSIDTHVFKFVDRVLNTENNRLSPILGMVPHGWAPHRAFVLDVCETPEGMKIVEINTINAAGFYAANIQDVVLSLEAMEK